MLLSLADPVSIIRISLEVRKEKSKLPDSKTETISVDAKNVGSEILGVHSIRRISRNMSPVGWSNKSLIDLLWLAFSVASSCPFSGRHLMCCGPRASLPFSICIWPVCQLWRIPRRLLENPRPPRVDPTGGRANESTYHTKQERRIALILRLICVLECLRRQHPPSLSDLGLLFELEGDSLGSNNWSRRHAKRRSSNLRTVF